MKTANVETERKYLIRFPDLSLLRAQDSCRVLEMVQTYLNRLPEEPDTERRVRSIVENGAVTYIFTQKKHCGYLSRYEDEREVSREEYDRLREGAYSELRKTRYAFPYAGHVMEIDVYPPDIGGETFDGYAILEVEMDDPDEAVEFPDFLEILREVTDDRRYHNKTLAKKLK